MLLNSLPAVGFIIAIVLSIIALFRKLHIKSKSVTPLPPGPRGLPIVGNLLDLPSKGSEPGPHWLRHKDLYGPISSITVLGQTIIIINDRMLAFELLDKRASKTSSRPHSVFAVDMVGWSKAPAALDNTNLLRTYRKAMARVIGSPGAVAKFDEVHEIEIRRLLWRLQRDPKNFVDHVRKAAGGLILRLSYGYVVDPHGNDYLVDLAERAIGEFALAFTPGLWMVDSIPALKYLPDWCPGAGFKKTARKLAANLIDSLEKPFAFTRSQMVRKKHAPSIASNVIEQGDSEEVAKWTAFSIYGAGVDTTVASIQAFLLAMTLYPDVQAKAQAEIDQVIGPSRLPTFSDRDNLPYMDAIVRETVRWHTVAPVAVPHKADENDIFHGCFIPKGAILIANSWAFNHDPQTHHRPFDFIPDRFLASKDHQAEPDAFNVSFGYGRRTCPGRFVASAAMFLAVAQCLAAFNISKAVDENGCEIEPKLGATTELVSYVLPFQCDITPRSDEYVALIRAAEQDHPFGESDAEFYRQFQIRTDDKKR
ncbi:cytochrome P450 [Tothia fuscella]|uniref:Cytochrome P450 n=1 Tax=Tothia fuscella TaxID=1048955 RepID=A0A9P4TVB3_9PEZI|nr:cytochrome P450 [Tothia fuscella]